MSAAFDTVDHSILLQRAEVSFGLSGTVLSWLTSFLDGHTQQVVFNGATSSLERITSGVPQGSVFGPLLFLLYTADVPLIASEFGLGVHCYADDGQLYLSGSAKSPGMSVSVVVDCIAEMDRWMSSNRLKLNTDKTHFIWLGSRQQLLKVKIDSIQLGSGSVPLKSSVNNLGVIFDSQLSMREHVCHVCRSSFYQLRQLRVVRGSLTFEASVQLVHAFINSRLDYCNSLLAGVSDQLIGQLQSVLRTAARLVLQKKKYDHISDDIQNKLHWLPIRQWISFKLCLLVFPLPAWWSSSIPFGDAFSCFKQWCAAVWAGLIARRLVAISLFHERSPRPSALVGLRSLGRLHGTRSQHTWKIKICLLLSSDQNSKLTFLAPNLYVFQLCLLTRLYVFGLVRFCPQATRHSRNGYWSVRERLQMIFRIVSYHI